LLRCTRNDAAQHTGHGVLLSANICQGGSLSNEQKEAVWAEIETELKNFESANGFTGPCEMIVAVGEK
jgi:hypothetical protein